MRGGTQLQAARDAPHLQASKPSSWELYFGADAWQADDRRHLLIADLVAYFASPPGWQLLTASAAPWHARVVVELDWQELLAATAATDLATAMQMQPGAALGCLACAAYEVGAGRWTSQAASEALAGVAAMQTRPACACPPSSAASQAFRLSVPTSGPTQNPHSPPCPQALFRVHAAQVQAQLPAIQQPGKVVVRLVNHPQGRRLISQVCPGPSCGNRTHLACSSRPTCRHQALRPAPTRST